jgi:penicillin-binding protein 2
MLFGWVLTDKAQGLPQDGELTLRPLLQQLGQRLLKGKQGSIVAIRPESGEILCLATHSPKGADVRLAIATAYAPGSTIKTAQALAMLSEGAITDDTAIPCENGFTEGNIRVGCHKHASPLQLKEALAQSCNTWFLLTFASMINDDFMYGSKDEAVDTWRDYMRSMGLGGPLILDMKGDEGGLLANSNYLNRRYKGKWDGKTIMWAGMGQGDITATPLQLCNLAVTIANRGWYKVPHIYKDTKEKPLAKRFKERRHTKVKSKAYKSVIAGMREAVVSGTASAINHPKYKICGKTGTIENPGKDHSAFIGYAPMEHPKIAVSVYVEHGGFGADMAAPMASLIIEMYLKGKLSPESEKLAQRLSSKKLF